MGKNKKDPKKKDGSTTRNTTDGGTSGNTSSYMSSSTVGSSNPSVEAKISKISKATQAMALPLVKSLQAQLDEIKSMGELYLSQGLLAQYQQAETMAEKAESALIDMKRRAGLPIQEEKTSTGPIQEENTTPLLKPTSAKPTSASVVERTKKTSVVEKKKSAPVESKEPSAKSVESPKVESPKIESPKVEFSKVESTKMKPEMKATKSNIAISSTTSSTPSKKPDDTANLATSVVATNILEKVPTPSRAASENTNSTTSESTESTTSKMTSVVASTNCVTRKVKMSNWNTPFEVNQKVNVLEDTNVPPLSYRWISYHSEKIVVEIYIPGCLEAEAELVSDSGIKITIIENPTNLTERSAWHYKRSAALFLPLFGRFESFVPDGEIEEVSSLSRKRKKGLLIVTCKTKLREFRFLSLVKNNDGVLRQNFSEEFLSNLKNPDLGCAFLDNFMSGPDLDAIRQGILNLFRAGKLSSGEVEAGVFKGVRSDYSLYVDENSIDSQRNSIDSQGNVLLNLKPFTSKLDQVMLALQTCLLPEIPDWKGKKLMRGRPMVAVYDGVKPGTPRSNNRPREEGGKYTCHYDSVGGDNGRVLTSILYLNPYMNSDDERGGESSDGGELRLYPKHRSLTSVNPYANEANPTTVTIAPLHGRLAVFFCDSRNLHEVLAVQGTEPRVAISCWYYDCDAVRRTTTLDMSAE